VPDPEPANGDVDAVADPEPADHGVDVVADAEPADHEVDAVADAEPADHEVGAVADADAAGHEVDAVPEPVFSVMQVVNVVFSLPSPSPVVHLRESEPPFRGIDFPIGLPEAQSIALALDEEKGARPSTHELLSAVLVATGADVLAVRFTGEREGTIIAELDLMTPNGEQILDCRPTDGIAVALRQAVPAPILCAQTLLID
jgi:hypothetical protein